MSAINDYVQQNLRLTVQDLSSFEQQFLIHIDTISPIEPTERDYFYDELFHGGYIFIADNGATYQTLTSYDHDMLVNRNASSSHFSIEPQFAFRGNLVGECLFGTKVIDGQTGTWMQLEAYATDILHIPAHLFSYVNYLITGYNQGPYGSSIHTEVNPIILNTQDPLKPAMTQPTIPLNTVEHQNITDIEQGITITVSDVFIDASEHTQLNILEYFFDLHEKVSEPEIPTVEPIIKVDMIQDQIFLPLVEPVLA